ncbi:Septum site-determining protein MinD [Phycisphaerae bacterium RAS1]|nr:Septum site-determining protein MinD [Phycisphaerae bacterium RAS1]
MLNSIRVIVVNADEEAAPELRTCLLAIDGVKIVAEIDEPAMLTQALRQFPAEVLLVHLDPNPTGMMEVVAPLIEQRKGQVVAIGMTEDRDAELVVRAMRIGMREFLWKPFPPEQLAEILQRVRKEAGAIEQRSGRLISVVGTSGGIGATSLATNLSVELARLETWDGQSQPGEKPRVAVVDLDFRFGQVAMYLDAQPSYTIAQLCESAEQLEKQLIDRVMAKHSSGVHVLAHPADMEEATRITAGQCAGALAALLEHYDFVVVDGPVRFDQSAKAVFDMTDVYILLLQLLVPSVRNSDRFLNELRRHGFNLDKLRIVCNRHGRDAGYLQPADVEATLGRKVDFFLPDDWKVSSTAVNVGTPLADHAPKSKLRQAYQQIAQALAAPGGESDGTPAASTPEPPRKGLLSFLAGQKA